MALARMGLSGDSLAKPLTDAQRAEISDVDRRFAAKIAEREIFLRAEIEKARSEGDAEASEQAAEQLRRERADLEQDRELAKDRIREGRAV